MNPRRILEGLASPQVPAHLRDDFVRLTARHLRGQASLMFIGYLLSLPFVVLAAPRGASDLVAWGLPGLVLVLSLTGLWLLRQRVEAETPLIVARRVLNHGWKVSTFIAAIGSVWGLASWAAAPPEVRIYYPAIMSLGTLSMGYCLGTVRTATVGALAVTLLPVIAALLLFGTALDALFAAMLVIAGGFLLLMMGRQQRLMLELVEERQRSRAMALTDPLTGIGNRRALLEAFAKLSERRETARLMVIDIDNFKAINDRFGHAIGDTVLEAFATILSRHARGSIHVARLGGEEFALLGPSSVLDPALALQLLAEIRNAMMPHDEQLTASIGVAELRLRSSEDWNRLYSSADRALYAAKRDGRNRVVSGEPGDDEDLQDTAFLTRSA
ncbi:GGDEF domain-containing protein [Erythrobacter mangrovi]|uniref:diguanylate cyclase n=1 Tax=Erythrobacter mangrovi TaxID=2739433 RepID=A0A7D3XAD0_9SPHN|nr:diguanylate cyclase [Erythrobacter mangrovi]QKG71755.1 diguanylate cyclase [Erythrobacter mangrovi]